MGTLPYILMNPAKRFAMFSLYARNNNAGPSVMVIYKREGGYLVQFIKDKKVKAASGWEDHFDASP